MQLNTNLLKFILIVGIVTLIFICISAQQKNDSVPDVANPEQLKNQLHIVINDPFKEFLDNQQQGLATQVTPVQTNQPIKIASDNSTITLPAGNDPFKVFLEAQIKAKPIEASISPFAK